MTPPSSANGHIPRDSLKESANNSKDSESTSGEQINEDVGISSPDTAQTSPAKENTSNRVDNGVLTDDLTKSKNSVSSVGENQSSKEESQKEGVPASDGSASQSKVTVDEEEANVISSATVGEADVPGASGNEETSEAIEENVDENKDASAGDKDKETDATQQRAASEVSFSGEKETVSVPDQTSTAGVTADTDVAKTNVPQQRVVSEVSISGENEADASQDQTQTVSGTAPDKDSEAAETDLARQRVTSDVSLPGEIDAAPVVNQTKTATVATSDHSAVPSDNELNSLPQESDSVSPATTESAQRSEPREDTTEDPLSLGGEQSSNDQNLGHDSVSATVEATEARDSSKEDSALDKKDTVDPLAESTDYFSLKSDIIYGRICTLSANVQIGSLEDPQGERTVTLTGSVYRVPRIDGGTTTPKPGEKIGIIKGDVTSTPVDNESSANLATLRGDLLAVSGEAASQGRVATASIDVLSCATGEKIATITADVAPNDDSESPSGVISGEVLGASENGSDEKIGTLAGKVVALTFDDDVASICSADDDLLKPRRESCFI